MKKVTFYIDDLEYMIRDIQSSAEITRESAERICEPLAPSFRARFTLKGDSTTPESYELYDENGNEMSINDLNGYQRGVVLGDCYRYYEGFKPSFGDEPYGVIKIEEEVIL